MGMIIMDKKKIFKIIGVSIFSILLLASMIVLVYHDKFFDKKEEVKVVDKTKPVIEASDIEIFKGEELNIEEKVKCSDNVDKDIKCNIEGEYDTNTVGEYKLTITAVDKSKNKSSKTITITVKEKEVESTPVVTNTNNDNKNPYYTEVIRNQNIVIVYGLDQNNNYTKVVKVFTCSVGKDDGTPTGTFTTTDKYVWRALFGGVYGQYATRITGSILFHSVPYTSQSKDSLEWDEYNKLGTAASMGCVRLPVSDVKWIYDNCPSGMTVKIYDGDIPSGITKPTTIKIDENNPNRGWDPTDPDPSNPNR